MSERDCKHGQLARSCPICELEDDKRHLEADYNLEIAKLHAALAQAERERDETELDISWLINNDIHNKAQPADQLAMIRERLLTIRSRRYKP